MFKLVIAIVTSVCIFLFITKYKENNLPPVKRISLSESKFSKKFDLFEFIRVCFHDLSNISYFPIDNSKNKSLISLTNQSVASSLYIYNVADDISEHAQLMDSIIESIVRSQIKTYFIGVKNINQSVRVIECSNFGIINERFHNFLITISNNPSLIYTRIILNYFDDISIQLHKCLQIDDTYFATDRLPDNKNQSCAGNSNFVAYLPKNLLVYFKMSNVFYSIFNDGPIKILNFEYKIRTMIIFTEDEYLMIAKDTSFIRKNKNWRVSMAVLERQS